MGTALALASAACYGIADVAGGLLSRRVNFALVGQAAAFLVMLAAAAVVPGRIGLADLGWGGLSGVGTGVAMAFLYRGLGRGAMSVVVPVSAVGGLAIPVVVGVALLGDRPTPLAGLGMAVAAPELWLVSRGRGSTGPAAPAAIDGMIAGLGIALQYLALAAAGPRVGIWPVAAGRLTATLAIAPLLVRSPSGRWAPARYRLGAVFAGCCAALALVTYLLAIREELVSIAVVLSSLYPVIPVLFGLTVAAGAARPRSGAGAGRRGCRGHAALGCLADSGARCFRCPDRPGIAGNTVAAAGPTESSRARRPGARRPSCRARGWRAAVRPVGDPAERVRHLRRGHRAAGPSGAGW